ncbi:MAG: serine hydrolase domain-containing protein [Bacteroidota bacterium]
MRTFFLGALLLLLALPAQAQSVRDTLTMRLQLIADNSDVPGFAVAVVSAEKTLYAHGFGFANRETGRPFTENTVLNLGSITKTVIGFVLMQLEEDGKVSLDDPINQHLPFPVRNPHFPNTPITVRQLATHTSSLTDGVDDMLIEKTYLFTDSVNFRPEELPEDYYSYFQIYRTNRSVTLPEFLKNAYTPAGAWYEKGNFLEDPPGTVYQYTNLGATLLAYLVETVAGRPFKELTREELFTPLGMEHTYWDLDRVPEEDRVTHYLSNGLAIPDYSLITYPDGGLRTSVSDFSLYLREMIAGLVGTGQLLTPKAYQALMTNQLTAANFPAANFGKAHGLLWQVNHDGDNISMNGADPGVVTYTLFTTSGNVGIAIFLNTNLYGQEALEADFRRIRGTLFQHIGKLLKE